jgi:integrase
LVLLSTNNPPLIDGTDKMPRLTKTPLTQRIIDNTPLPSTGIKELRDHSVRGLVVRIFPSGSRSWSLEYRSPATNKNARMPITANSLVDARASALKHKVTLGAKRDPAIEAKDALQARRIEHARAMSVADALDAYERDFIDHPKAASRRDRIARLRRAVEPFKTRPVASLAKGELIDRLDGIQSESGPIARNRSQAEMRAWLGWLHDRDRVPAIVLAGVKKKIGEKQFERTRVLTDAELGAILIATADGSAFSDIIRVLLHTGMRKSEAANLQPRDLDFGQRTIKVRGEISKTNRERIIPMAEAIAPMLAARADALAREGYIFGEGSDFGGPLSGWGKPTDRLRDVMPEGDHWTLHDIRRTVATRLHAAGVDALIVEDLLGHISGVRGGVAGVYNRSETLGKQATALNDWADKLAALTNVVPLRRRA